MMVVLEVILVVSTGVMASDVVVEMEVEVEVVTSSNVVDYMEH